MNNITIQNLDDDLNDLLEKRAIYYGRSLEEEVKEILRAALTANIDQPLNLASAIDQRFAHLGDFKLPIIPREPMREPPNVEDMYDRT
jgi:antitoxin FitA